MDWRPWTTSSERDVNMFFIRSNLTCLRKTNKLSQPNPYYAAFLSPAVVRVRAGVILPCSAWFPVAKTAPWTYAFISAAAGCQVRAEPRNMWNESHIFLSHLQAENLNFMLKRYCCSPQRAITILGLEVAEDIIRPVVDTERLRTTSLSCTVCWKHSVRITHHPHHGAWGWRHPAMGMLLCSGSWKACEDWGEIGCSKKLEKSSRKTCCSLLDNSDWLDLFSSKKKRANIKPKLHRNGFKTTMLSPTVAESDLKPNQHFWQHLKIVVHSW